MTLMLICCKILFVLIFILLNKNYYVVRNARCAHSRYTLKLSHFLINESTEYIQNGSSAIKKLKFCHLFPQKFFINFSPTGKKIQFLAEYSFISLTLAPRILDQFSTGFMLEDGVKTSAAPECKDGLGWVYYNGHCYMFNR